MVVFAASVLVLLACSSAAAQSNPTATLVYRTNVDLVETTDRTIVILASGPPPAQGGVLVTDDGGATISVQIFDPESQDCLNAPVLNSGLGSNRWCVRLTGIKAGQAFKGQLMGPSSTIALTVAARDKLRFPIAFAAVALVLSVGLLFLTTKALPLLVTSIALAQVRDDGLAGLTEWIRTARIHLSLQDTLVRVRWAQRHGKQRLTAIRASLQVRLHASAIPKRCPLHVAAQSEAARHDFAISDLLTERGIAAISRAERLTSLVVKSDAAIVDFHNISGVLVSLTSGPNLHSAQDLMDRGNALAEEYLAEFTYEPFVKRLQDTLDVLRGYVPLPVPPPKVPPHFVPFAAATADMAILGVNIGPTARKTLSFGMVFLAAILLMAVAVAVVLSTQYFPNQTFGSFADYVGLVAAMLGSSSAAGILTVLLLLRSPQEWYG